MLGYISHKSPTPRMASLPAKPKSMPLMAALEAKAAAGQDPIAAFIAAEKRAKKPKYEASLANTNSGKRVLYEGKYYSSLTQASRDTRRSVSTIRKYGEQL